MIAGIRIGSDEITFEQATEREGIYQEVLGDRVFLVDVNCDWACWLGPAGWFRNGSDTEELTDILWVRAPHGSEWLFRPDTAYGQPPSRPRLKPSGLPAIAR